MCIRDSQYFEAARCNKTRKNGNETAKIPTNLTAVKTNLTAAKTNLTDESTKYKFHKVRIPPKYKGHKVQTQTRHKGHKVQIRKYKPHLSCFHRVTRRTRIPANHKDDKSDSTPPRIMYCRTKGMLPRRNKHTPYGPHNLPHMVLCTKKGPDNA